MDEGMSLRTEGSSPYPGTGQLVGAAYLMPSVTVAEIARNDSQDECSEPRRDDPEAESPAL